MLIERVGVIGGGLMGSGIAEVCARAGSAVIVHEINAEAAEAAMSRIENSLDRAVEREKLDQISHQITAPPMTNYAEILIGGFRDSLVEGTITTFDVDNVALDLITP
ncbi:MAG: NAD(P)-binding domain-containing protein [Acidobacteria bacterium]|nr:NAD(P)-binding domain-containing protein [Acidobacteriota bacterium]